MTISIKHNFVSGKEDGDDATKIQPSHWDAEHNISGIPFNGLIGSKVKVPVFIETKTPSGDSSITFSGLNGDSDIEYIIEGDVDWSDVSGGDVSLRMTYNSIESNYQTTGGRYVAGTHEVSNKSYQEIIMGGWSAACSSWFITNVKVKTGTIKMGYVQSGCYDISGHTTTNIYQTSQIYCDNTADNVTSIVLTGVNGKITGTIKLYKLVEVTL